MKNILVAVDGSEHSKRALMKAKQIGTAFDSNVTILHVIELNLSHEVISEYVSHEDAKRIMAQNTEIEESVKRGSNKLLDTYTELFKDYKGQVNTMVKTGQAANVIIDVSKEGYDILVIGSRGLGIVSRVVLGSVSNKVANHINIPVLIVQ